MNHSDVKSQYFELIATRLCIEFTSLLEKFANKSFRIIKNGSSKQGVLLNSLDGNNYLPIRSSHSRNKIIIATIANRNILNMQFQWDFFGPSEYDQMGSGKVNSLCSALAKLKPGIFPKFCSLGWSRKWIKKQKYFPLMK